MNFFVWMDDGGDAYADRMKCGSMMLLAGLVAGMSAGLAQQSKGDEKDPLHGLVGEVGDPLGKGELRLNVTLVRMAKADATRLLLEDDGVAGSWEERLVKLKEEGKLEAVHVWSDDSRGEKGIWEDGYQRRRRYLSLGEAAVIWDWNLSSEGTHDRKPDLAEFFDGLVEEKWGQTMKVDFEVVEDSPWVDLKFELFDSVTGDRPCQNWPIQGVSTPKVIFRPWELQSEGRVRRNEVFFMGAQMDVRKGDWPGEGNPDLMGEKHDWVELAFGKVTGPKVELREGATGLRFQSWTLAVEPQKFVKWMMERKRENGDAEVLARWIAEEEVLATGAVMTKSGVRSVVKSERRWEDASGFEPSGNPKEYRPKPCETDEFALRHEIELDLVRELIGRNGGDPFGVGGDVSEGQRVDVSLRMKRPLAPARWVRWKTSMDRGDDDPHAIEVTEGDGRNGGESFAVSLMINLGEVVMVNAQLKQGRVHTTFVRVVEDVSGAKVQGLAVGESKTRGVSIWEVETPVSWAGRWEGAEMVDVEALAAELLNGVGKGDVELKALSSHEGRSGTRAEFRSGKPVAFFGGNYLNMALSLQGVFFNTRNVGSELVGTEGIMEYSAPGEDWWRGHSLLLNSTTRDEVEWRHWGLWIDEMKGTNAQNCGFLQPAFPTQQLNLSAKMEPGAPRVVAMMRVSPTGRKELKPARLRWWIGMIDGEPEVRLDRRVDPKAFGKEDQQGLLQALVLKGNGEVAGEDGRVWLDGVAKQEVQVLDSMTVLSAEDGGFAGSTGVDYFFPNGREIGHRTTEDPILHAKKEMTAGTTFSNQVDLRHRLVGMKFSCGHGGWMLERDEREPEVITDVFQGERTEWPFDAKSKWEDMPKVTVNVQRPIFSLQKAEGPVPRRGHVVLHRLSADTMLMVRWVTLRP